MAFSVSLEVESCKYEVFEGGVGVLWFPFLATMVDIDQ